MPVRHAPLLRLRPAIGGIPGPVCVELEEGDGLAVLELGLD